MQLAGMTDELTGARYDRFINKRFSELGANSSKNPGRISRSGSRVGYRRTKRQAQKRRQERNRQYPPKSRPKCFNAKKELTEISEVLNTMNQSWGKEKWRANVMEKIKENAALSDSCSRWVAPTQEQMNREAANGGSLFRMTVTSKIEETIMDLLRMYRLNTFAQQLHEQLIDHLGRLNRS